MRKQNTLVFDDFVYANAIDVIWTDAKFNDLLARFDQTSLFAVVDSVVGAASTLNVQIEHSGDGRNWLKKNAAGAEINAVVVGVGATTSAAGNDPGTVPTAAFVRLTVWIGGGAGNSAHVKIYVCNRDQA
jgi:hypothetical protein